MESLTVNKINKKTRGKTACLLLAVLLILLSVTGCGEKESTGAAVLATDGALSRIEVEYSSEDMDGTWDDAAATKIELQNNTYAIDGTGASAEGKILTISEAGTYVFSGTLTDGQIQVSAGEEDTVQLVLNGADITCSDNGVIYSIESEKTILTLAAGSVNTIRDGSVYTVEGTGAEEGADEPDAAIFSISDLTINGSGTLDVEANYNDGIVSKDDLVITGGNISITAVNDGIKGRDSIAINHGVFELKVNGDGLQASNDEEADKGWISLDGGTFNITSGMDGIQAETQLQTADTEISVLSGGGSTNAVTAEDAESAKGLKAGTGILAEGGSITIDSSDDAVHTNGDLVIEAGEFEIAAGDDGMHADASLTVNGGTISVNKSYEGIEASSITVNDGTVEVISTDDGFNAAGGNDGSSVDGRPGENSFAADAEVFIHINGGTVSVDADGDGIDSNGSIAIGGGTVLVNGPTNNGNGAMDYNGECLHTGGILAIAGSAGMVQSPGETSTQNSVTVYYSTVQAAGTLVTLTDEDGKAIFSFAPSKEYQSIVISTPDVETGKTYTLSSGGSSTGTASQGLYTGETVSGGTELTKITISEVITKISDDGSAYTGDQGGMGGQRPAGDPGTAPEGKVRPEGAAPMDGKTEAAVEGEAT